MTYFKSVKSLDDLKEQFRKLAKKNHPDLGGDPEVMKQINQEYDQIFPVWKNRYNATAENPTTETADSTRSEFYTQNGWKGSNHDWSRSTKEVAAIVRKYVKETYPTYKFSVRFSQASMCSEVHVTMKEAPQDIYKTYEALTEQERNKVWQKAEYNHWIEPFGCLDAEHNEILKKAYEDHSFLKVFTEVTQAVIDDVDAVVNSYNFSDCDGMIDYFDVDFYYFGVQTSDVKIVPKTPRIKNQKKDITKTQKTPENSADELPEPASLEEYDIKKTKHTKTGETIYTVRIVRKLNRQEYLETAEFMRSIGGYYSRFVHAFVFKEDPTERLVAA